MKNKIGRDKIRKKVRENQKKVKDDRGKDKKQFPRKKWDF